jgi:hypothetical protein
MVIAVIMDEPVKRQQVLMGSDSEGDVSNTSYNDHSGHGDNGTQGTDVEDGESVVIPFLSNGYDWKRFVTTTSEPNMYVTPDYIPEVGPITEEYVVARCTYLKMELTADNKEQIKDIMEAHQHQIKRTLKQWLQLYWVEVSQHCGIKFGQGNDVTTFAELQSAVRQCRNVDNAKQIVTCLYLSFDFCGNYRKKIAKCLMQQFGLILDEGKRCAPEKKSCGKRKPRKKRNCFEKLVTQIITEQRKNINNLAVKTCGIQFTYQRTGSLISEKNEFDFRKKRRFYTWMLLGEFVSYCHYFDYDLATNILTANIN